MPSTSYLNNLQFATGQVNLYGCFFIFITGIFGTLLNIVVFTTLKTFRQTTCAFYLVTASIANIGILSVMLLRIIYDGFGNGSNYPPLLCKFRSFLTQYGVLMSLTSMCLATFDQFISMTTYKHWSSLKIARCVITFASVLWFLESIFSFIYYESNLNRCIITNAIYLNYFTYFHSIVLFGILPLVIMIIFSVLAFFKIRSLASRQLNIVRLSRDRQLTAMTLFNVLFIVILSIPFVFFLNYNLTLNTKDPIKIALNQLIYGTIVIVYYINYSVSFLIDKIKV